MNIGKSLEIVKDKLLMIKKLLKNDEENGHSSSYEMQKEDFEAIETLLTAYEKEKEKNKELYNPKDMILRYYDNGKGMQVEIKGFISIDKLKEIVDECIPKKENIITRELEYTPNTNANSYLTQEILSLIKEE